MQLDKLDSQFLNYLIDTRVSPGERVPTLQEISGELGISVGKLREQIAVARSMGLISMKPRVGIQREPLDFSKAILPSVLFSLGSGETTFIQFSQLRRAVEAGFWLEAVSLLTESDKKQLREIIAQAWGKLHGDPIHVPNNEHRQFHLHIFNKLDNPFVQGLLAAYWDAYEASELTRFASYEYWLDVWSHHEKIIDAIDEADFEYGRQLLTEHFNLLVA